MKFRRGEICGFWPAFKCCAHSKVSWNTFFQLFLTSSFSTFFCYFTPEIKIKRLNDNRKKYLDQLSGARSTRKRVKIHNSLHWAIPILFCVIFVQWSIFPSVLLGGFPLRARKLSQYQSAHSFWANNLNILLCTKMNKRTLQWSKAFLKHFVSKMFAKLFFLSERETIKIEKLTKQELELFIL